MTINSFYNQDIIAADVANKFDILAATAPGAAEAIIHETKPCEGIQWHPERNNSVKYLDKYIMRKIFA